ncbi:alanine racemase [Oxalobacter vibrioformis]|uniref:Alanine racemase n=1 Tax=Oxalobacter vibrioformis TaxID=933080 RepID=A0A9E9LZ06_9BURK|nr:alanine racemase [Oxalobacter vibrioformis]WAW10270.1 alanine racemase [Oxalobacter vibrioformis]
MSRPLIAYIDIAAMQHNLSVVRKEAPRSSIWAVVKANGYGHGLERCARAFIEADGYALTEIEAAVHLRDLGYKKPILLLEGFFSEHELPVIAHYDLEFAVHSEEQIAMLESKVGAPRLKVHLKMNTGMNRLGFKPDQYRAAYDRLKALQSVQSISLMTHMANAEIAAHPQLAVAEQMRRFEEGAKGMDEPRSLSNSATLLLHPEIFSNWVRPGIMLYGGTPGGKTAEAFGVKPAMTLTSELIQILDIDKGEAIGYGSQYVAPHPMRIGVVACGYADGYPRSAPEGTPILVDGIRTRLVGRVSMDMITVDLTSIPDAHFGSAIVLWGDGLPIDEVAEAAGTVGYELMCALSLRPHIVER